MNFIEIRSFDNYISANLQLLMLKDHGIECYLKDEYTITIDPLLCPAIGGMKLMVSDQQAVNAVSIIETAELNFIKNLTCPYCGCHSIELIKKTQVPSGFWQQLLFRLSVGSSQKITNRYWCNYCNRFLVGQPEQILS